MVGQQTFNLWGRVQFPDTEFLSLLLQSSLTSNIMWASYKINERTNNDQAIMHKMQNHTHRYLSPIVRSQSMY